MVIIKEQGGKVGEDTQWGDRTLLTMSSDQNLQHFFEYLLRVPVLGWFFAAINMTLVRMWLFLHSLPLPPFLESVLHFMDRVLEKLVPVVSYLIWFIFGDRNEGKDKGRKIEGANKKR